MNPLIQFKPTTLSFVIVSALMCFALSPVAHAVVPAPDGGYPGGNTAEGDFALQNLTTGNFNTALGVFALFSNTAGVQNTATGAGALFFNTGNNNTANGAGALFSNISGTANTAMGFAALSSNTTISGNVGSQNTAIGNTALASNTIGTSNTAVGSQALLNNDQGNRNTAVGKDALFSNTSVNSVDNTAVGFQALFSNTTGHQNNAFGSQALLNNVTGNFNTAIGDVAGRDITKNWNIDIGKDVFGTSTESFVTRIGISDPADPSGHVQKACFIGGIVNAPITGTPVVVSATGQLGVADTSSARFKDEIKPMDEASEAILALKPITFRYKQEIDPARSPQFGLLAEEVAKVNPDLVTRDAKGELYTVRYEAVNAMLLNEFLKEHRTVQEQQATIAQLKKGMESLTAQLKEQAAQIQKVSAQLEVSKPAPQTVANNQ